MDLVSPTNSSSTPSSTPETPISDLPKTKSFQIEEKESFMETQDPETPIRELRSKFKGKTDSKSRVVTSRCTRSQVAPDWTVQETLVLVSQIASIDADFLRSLPSVQKWKMIVNNCNALGVSRPLNQCRKKWESLLTDYKRIKDWETQHGDGPYWSLESEKKIEFGLPLIDEEIFKAVDDALKVQEDRSGTEPDSESEKEVELLNAIIDSGSTKSKRGRGRVRKNAEEEEMVVKEEEMVGKEEEMVGKEEEMAVKEEEMIVEEEEIAVELLDNAELAHSAPEGDLNESKDNAANYLKKPVSTKQKRGRGRGRGRGQGRSRKAAEKEDEKVVKLRHEKAEHPRKEVEEEDVVIVKLREDVELIHALLRGDLNESEGNAINESKKDPGTQMDLVRQQGYQLIDVLGSVVSTLDQLSDMVQECM